jgi:hypothetical protein
MTALILDQDQGGRLVAKHLWLVVVAIMFAGIAGAARADVTLSSPFANIQAAMAAAGDKAALASALLGQVEADLLADPLKDEQVLDLIANTPGAINASNASAVAALVAQIAQKADDATFLAMQPQSSAGIYLALLQMAVNPLVSQADPGLYEQVLARAKSALDSLGEGDGKIDRLRQIADSTEPPSFAVDPPGGNAGLFNFGQSPTQTGSAN